MEEKPSQENNVNNVCRCPHCACCFCTENDLKRHIDVFGTSKPEHAAEFQRVHGRLEHSSFAGSE